MDQLSSSSSSFQVRFPEDFKRNIENPVPTEPMTRAVTLIPCGHMFNEDTVIQCLARNKLCPNDSREIVGYVPSYTIRQLAENAGSLFIEEEGSCPEIKAHLIKGKQHVEAGDSEQAVEAILEALKLSLRREKAQEFLNICLEKSEQSVSVENALPPIPLPEIAFGKAKWARYFGDIGIEPPLPPNIDEILNSPCIFDPEKKVSETHFLVLIPNTVDGELFHLDALRELIQNPKAGFSTRYRHYKDDIKNELGTKSQPSHWVLMTRDVIPDSFNSVYKDQQVMVKSYARKSRIPYELPTALEAATVILLEYVQNRKRCYGDSPWTYTRCQEKLSGNQRIAAVGAFNLEGLDVLDFDKAARPTRGVGALRRFS